MKTWLPIVDESDGPSTFGYEFGWASLLFTSGTMDDFLLCVLVVIVEHGASIQAFVGRRPSLVDLKCDVDQCLLHGFPIVSPSLAANHICS